MSPGRRAELRALHREHREYPACTNGEKCGRRGRCDGPRCDESYPCPTISLLDIADERDRLRAFAAEVVWGHFEFGSESQCPWCLWVARPWQPIHECELTQILDIIPTSTEYAALAAGAAPEPQEGGR